MLIYLKSIQYFWQLDVICLSIINDIINILIIPSFHLKSSQFFLRSLNLKCRNLFKVYLCACLVYTFYNAREGRLADKSNSLLRPSNNTNQKYANNNNYIFFTKRSVINLQLKFVTIYELTIHFCKTILVHIRIKIKD